MSDIQNLINGVEPVLMEFYATWCPHCQREMPTIEKVKENFQGKAHVVTVDGEENPALMEKYHVHSYPTFILFKEGQEVWRDSGEKPYSELADMIDRFR